MANLVLKDASTTVGGVDLSAWCISVDLTTGAETPDNTAMGATTRIVLAGGLKTWSATVTFNQDYAAGGPDATLGATEGTALAFVGKPTSGSVSATNPSYTGTGVVSSYNPISGSIGDKQVCSVTLTPTTALTRATS